MAYFSRQEAELQLSPAIMDRIFGAGSELGFGEIGATSGSLRFTQMSEQASSYVDLYLKPAGFAVPLSSVPAIIKQIAIDKFIVSVYVYADLPINDVLLAQVGFNDSVLQKISIGELDLDGPKQDLNTGTGGSLFTSSAGSLGPQLGKAQLGGTFL